jgi:phosphoribosylglycinamide formyltransferase-1
VSRTRLAVLISGRGSNLAALLAACCDPAYPAEVALVVADDAGAAGLAHAGSAGVECATVARQEAPDRAAFEAKIERALTARKIDLVCLAGFMRVLSPAFVERWRDRVLNIHPSLLPAFPGLDTHRRALEAGVRIHGATVHFVRAEVDRGPIVAQAAVPVLAGDTPEALAARVLAAEHRLYPLAVRLVASGAARVEEGRVAVSGAAGPAALLLTQAD